jgi:hypothetical protein
VFLYGSPYDEAMKDKNSKAVNAEVVSIYLALGYDAFMARVMALNYEAALVAKANLAADPYRH